MPTFIAALAVALLIAGLHSGAAQAQTPNKPTALEKMTSPDQARKMRECERRAAQQKIKMAERSKFVMDCMEKK
jgi:hypothetical protein